jgi:hypothetical protein
VGLVQCAASARAICPVAWTYRPMDRSAAGSLGSAVEVVEVSPDAMAVSL